MRILFQTNGNPFFESGGYNLQMFQLIKMYYEEGHTVGIILTGIPKAEKSLHNVSFDKW